MVVLGVGLLELESIPILGGLPSSVHRYEAGPWLAFACLLAMFVTVFL